MVDIHEDIEKFMQQLDHAMKKRKEDTLKKGISWVYMNEDHTQIITEHPNGEVTYKDVSIMPHI